MSWNRGSESKCLILGFVDIEKKKTNGLERVHKAPELRGEYGCGCSYAYFSMCTPIYWICNVNECIGVTLILG